MSFFSFFRDHRFFLSIQCRPLSSLSRVPFSHTPPLLVFPFTHLQNQRKERQAQRQQQQRARRGRAKRPRRRRRGGRGPAPSLRLLHHHLKPLFFLFFVLFFSGERCEKVKERSAVRRDTSPREWREREKEKRRAIGESEKRSLLFSLSAIENEKWEKANDFTFLPFFHQKEKKSAAFRGRGGLSSSPSPCLGQLVFSFPLALGRARERRRERSLT